MSFSTEKKNSIILYLMEQIQKGNTSAVKKTAETFETTVATVHKYLDMLLQDNVIRKLKRGQYELVKASKEIRLKRSAGELNSEQRIFDMYIKPELVLLPKNAVEIWEYISGEMINNIIDHSEAENVCITVSSDYLNTTLHLSDDGVGIFEKIKNYFDYDTIDDAVGELFKGKLTTDAENHSGEGIFFSSRIADSFVIVSSGKTFTHNRFDPDVLRDIIADDLTAAGTSVFVELSNHTQKKTRDVFDEFADVTGGFTRTKIPVRNYFDSSPVSRSQAKRLCNRLENFKEVELDFTDMEWMGQGFAHQLFVVFQNSHPEIKLIPINMNDAVGKMYNHVIAN